MATALATKGSPFSTGGARHGGDERGSLDVTELAEVPLDAHAVLYVGV